MTRKRDKSAALAYMRKALKRLWPQANPVAMKELGNEDCRKVGRLVSNGDDEQISCGSEYWPTLPTGFNVGGNPKVMLISPHDFPNFQLLDTVMGGNGSCDHIHQL